MFINFDPKAPKPPRSGAFVFEYDSSEVSPLTYKLSCLLGNQASRLENW